MQREAIDESIRILQQHEKSDSGGLPVGQARGKIILPCGTGKTRISLCIIEKLTPAGQLSVVLCPSIALVAQIRREYLQQSKKAIRVLAVCSDDTAGYAPAKEGVAKRYEDPTLDNSNVSANEIKGAVTTEATVIATWIRDGTGNDQVNIIIGTYQSSHRIAEALIKSKTTATVMVADEAHRTAGIRRIRKLEERIRDFTVCHDNSRFPAKYRIYQTATPRVYDTSGSSQTSNPKWVVRNMDDETIFGVELYRRSYTDAVDNGWLADYRIIALGINDPDAYAAANRLARTQSGNKRNPLTTSDFLKGLTLALVMGGGTTNVPEGEDVLVKSCIAFMNTVAKSKAMAEHLQSETVRQWVQGWLNANRPKQKASKYKLMHLDASSNVASRENAKDRLGLATGSKPFGIVNVGIFGEGTDAPSLSAVAFLEPRKSPIDVIQAVGRAMRTAQDKVIGYVICPIIIPPHVDAERWLMHSSKEDGWSELGQILVALRAHDSRIEDKLSELLQLYVPEVPERESNIVAVASKESRRIQYYGHVGAPGAAQRAAEDVLKGRRRASEVFLPLSNLESVGVDEAPKGPSNDAGELPPELAGIIAAKEHDDGSFEMRVDSVVHVKPGQVDMRKTKAKGRDMINKGTGVRLPRSYQRGPRQTRQAGSEGRTVRLLQLTLTGLEDNGRGITANLLTKSGLSGNRVRRDLNILRESVGEAARHLSEDGLSTHLDKHFELHRLKDESRQKQADGCTIAALLLMNAAMLHQRIAAGHWLTGVSDLAKVKNDPNVLRHTEREWQNIMNHDFHPVLKPAVDVIVAVDNTGKKAGLERALRHVLAEAERIAEAYADMGADHAGELFNRVMGNQASDGAFFTRPTAASIAARLALDACGEADWNDPSTWEAHQTVDLACGSGTLLTAMLTEMKRRAAAHGANEIEINQLQKLAVQGTIHGLDINPVSLQLAASQLTAGNHHIRYRRMGLHLMPYGPLPTGRSIYNRDGEAVGSLELLAQKAIVSRPGSLPLDDDRIGSRSVWTYDDDAELEDAVEAVKDARIVIMNPPFTNRTNMGKKFPKEDQKSLRARVDTMESVLVHANPSLMEFVDKNSIRPLFVALADHCVRQDDGVIAMIEPTIALSGSSGLTERQILAQRYHVHSVLTSHDPTQINLSQHTNINESIVVLRRHCNGPTQPTRIICLDKLPIDDSEVQNFHECLVGCNEGPIGEGWGEVFHWPAERIKAGDWTAAVWRSPDLAHAACQFANHEDLHTISAVGLSAHATGQLLRGSCKPAAGGGPDSFPILKSKSADGQTRILSVPDEHWCLQKPGKADAILDKAGYLLITAGQATNTARVTATASDKKYVGNGWMPVTGLSPLEAKAVAVFINSTPGRLQLMRTPGRKLEFPTYSTAEAEKIHIPDVKRDRIRETLANCWERTRDMKVPQFRDDECEVRQLWDEAVAFAMDWDSAELERLRLLLHREPRVCGRSYGQYADEPEGEPGSQ